MQVVLSKRKLKDGTESLYLDYYVNGKRQREFLGLYLYPGRKIDNKQTLDIAEVARAKRDLEIKSKGFGFLAPHKKKADFLLFMNSYIEIYDKKDINKYYAVQKHFKDFAGIDKVPCSMMSELMMEDFKKYLDKHVKGETSHSYFQSFRKILKRATKEGYFLTNPAADVVNKNDGRWRLTKAVLFDNEIQKLLRTPCSNSEVKRASMFSSQCGIRLGDIRKLQWRHIFLDTKDPYVDFSQNKTENANTIALNYSAVKLLGKPGKPFELVFDLPSDTGIRKNLKNWMKRAKIHKHITFHCFRHSCATNLLINGVDLKRTSKVLGHTTTRHTEKYTHISDAMKHQDVKKLPRLRF